MTLRIDDKNLAKALDICLEESKPFKELTTSVMIRWIDKLYAKYKVDGEVIGNVFKDIFLFVKSKPEIYEKYTGENPKCACSFMVKAYIRLDNLTKK